MKNKEYKIIKVSENDSVVKMEESVLENVKTIELLQKEVENLRKINSKITTADEEVIEEEKNESLFELTEMDNENDILLEIEYYFSKINKIDFSSTSNLQEEILMALPSLKHGNFQMILYGINILILKEINEMRVFVETEKVNLTKEELKQFKDEIIRLQSKITIINNTIDSKKTNAKVGEEQELNNIVFMETSSGNIYAIEDLDGIPKEYYAGFYELFKSIQDGTFKNIRYLSTTNHSVAGISEVKGFKKRIIFDRVNNNTYVIIAVLPKKSDWDKGYKEKLKNRISIYRMRENDIKEKSNNDDYLKLNQEILDKIYEHIKPIQEEIHQEKRLK